VSKFEVNFKLNLLLNSHTEIQPDSEFVRQLKQTTEIPFPSVPSTTQS